MSKDDDKIVAAEVRTDIYDYLVILVKSTKEEKNNDLFLHNGFKYSVWLIEYKNDTQYSEGASKSVLILLSNKNRTGLNQRFQNCYYCLSARHATLKRSKNKLWSALIPKNVSD